MYKWETQRYKGSWEPWKDKLVDRESLDHSSAGQAIDIYYIKDKKVMNKQWELKSPGQYSGQDYALNRPLWDQLYQFTQIGGRDAIFLAAKIPDGGIWDKIKTIFKDTGMEVDSGTVQHNISKLIEDEIKEHGQIRWYKEFDESDFKMLANVLYDIYMKKIELREFRNTPTDLTSTQRQQLTKGDTPKSKKVKVTESQYKRLIKENNGEFGRLTDKVTPFIVKLFKLIEKKTHPQSTIPQRMVFLTNDMALPTNEALLVAYNYDQFYKENMTNWDNLIGKPLQYKGIYQFTTEVPVSAEFWARAYAPATIYTIADSKEDALQNAKMGNFLVDENAIEDHNIDWDYDLESMSVAEDMLQDNLDDGFDDPSFEVSTGEVDSYMLHTLMLQNKLTPPFKMKIKLTESQYKKVLLREFGEVVRDPKEWYIEVQKWVDSPNDLDFETNEYEVVVYDKNGAYLGYYDKDQNLGFVVTEYGIGLEDEEEPIEEQEETTSTDTSSGGGTGSYTKWDDIVSPVRRPANTLDNTPWSVSPVRGPDNTLDNTPWSVSPVRGPANELT